MRIPTVRSPIFFKACMADSKISNKTVKDIIAQLVSNEDPAKPLSDQEGFLYLYPDGTPDCLSPPRKFWNATNACCGVLVTGRLAMQTWRVGASKADSTGCSIIRFQYV